MVFKIPKEIKEIQGGSLPDNNIFLPFKGISRRHFLLHILNEKTIIKDLNSTNGTYVNGKKISEFPLNKGDVISVGCLDMLYISNESDHSLPQNLPKLKVNIFMEEKTKSTDKIKRKKNFLPKTIYHFPNLNIPEDVVLGISPEMYIPYKKLSMCANNNLPVLLIGETGVGKEIFAKICFLSSSYNKNFIAINCSSIPKELVESELFGIAKGTATGVLQKEGKLLLANGGILLLDELDSLSEEIQIKLLRVLEEKMFYPLGCKTPIKTDFKLISTIKKDPHILIKNGTLREDLYHRISCLEIFIPPLRDRKEDIKILSELFLQLACKSEKKDFICFSNDALEILENYDYLGNIRELKNIIFETVVYTPNKNIIQAEDLPEKISQKLFETNFSSNTKDINFHNILNDFKKNLITSALKTYKGNLNAVAKHLKISRTGLYKIIKRLKIKI